MKITCWPPQDSLGFILLRSPGHNPRRCFRLLRQSGIGGSPLELRAKDRRVLWAANDGYDIARFVQAHDPFIGHTMVRQREPLPHDLLAPTRKVSYRELDPYQVPGADQSFHLSVPFLLERPCQSLYAEGVGGIPANQVLQGIEPGS